jgi:dihydropyrimidinase
MKTCIKNGTICFEDRLEQADLLIENERIAGIGPCGTFQDFNTSVDAEGCYIFPGFIDIHTHLDDVIGRRHLADSYRTGSQAALQNGITTLYSFITQQQSQSLTVAVEQAMAKASGNSFCDYMWHLTPVRFDDGGWKEIQNWISKGFRTFKFYTTYKDAGIFSDYHEIEERVRLLHKYGCTILIHCEDDKLLDEARQGDVDWTKPITHASVRPAAAEVQAIQRVVDIARKTGARIHIVHVSTPEGLECIREAQKEILITCETCPQYLFLDESYLSRPEGHRWICSPPLRSEEQRALLTLKTRNGDIDIFATDHCAFSKNDKDDWKGDIRDVPNGVAGIGGLTHLVFTLFEEEKNESAFVRIGQHLSMAPAKIVGRYPQKGTIKIGSDADLVVLNPYRSEKKIISSAADTYETYPDLTTTVEMKFVFLRGSLAVRDGQLVEGKEPMGECLCGE